MKDVNELLKDLSFSPDYTLLCSSCLWYYFDNFEYAEFEFTSGQYFIFRKNSEYISILIDLKHERAFWSRSMNDLCDVLDSYGFSSIASNHPELYSFCEFYIILDPNELLDDSMALINICYSKEILNININKFIKEYGYYPVIWKEEHLCQNK